MSNDFPQYCSLALPGYLACPNKSLPWYCYAGPLGRAKCANDGYIPQDAVTQLANLPLNLLKAGGEIMAHLDIVLIALGVGAAGIGVLYVANSIKSLRS